MWSCYNDISSSLLYTEQYILQVHAKESLDTFIFIQIFSRDWWCLATVIHNKNNQTLDSYTKRTYYAHCETDAISYKTGCTKNSPMEKLLRISNWWKICCNSVDLEFSQRTVSTNMPRRLYLDDILLWQVQSNNATTPITTMTNNGMFVFVIQLPAWIPSLNWRLLQQLFLSPVLVTQSAGLKPWSCLVSQRLPIQQPIIHHYTRPTAKPRRFLTLKCQKKVRAWTEPTVDQHLATVPSRPHSKVL